MLYQVEQLKSKSAIISQLIQDGKLKIAGAVYNLDTGKVDFLG
ncbi:MAG TPA: hypothetical protein VK203_17205 [Nostocaceae cyanobacterium]|nr:hypothetical protein [Nostocaceae cyanobacterium]